MQDTTSAWSLFVPIASRLPKPNTFPTKIPPSSPSVTSRGKLSRRPGMASKNWWFGAHVVWASTVS